MTFARRPSHLPSAFTLVEILVVLAIIFILAAILFPVFNRAREGGRRAACQSNLKQIGMGLLQYSQDYDEIFVADWYGLDTHASNETTQPASTPRARYKWPDAIYPYVKSEQVFTCPSASGDAATPWVYYGHLSVETFDYGSYIIMHGYGALQDTRTPPVSHPILDDLVRLSRAESPSTTAWVLDGDGAFFASVDTSEESISNLEARHFGLIDTLFVDGHVKAMAPERINGKKNGVMSAATIQDD